MDILFFSCVLAMGYAYVGYPLILWMLSKKNGDLQAATQAELPTIAVIIAGRNEAKALPKKLENTLSLDYPSELKSIIVVSDGSDDETEEVVKSFADRGVKLIAQKIRGGKEEAQKAGVSQTEAEIIVFTDAKVTLDNNALQLFAGYFANKEVGAVSSIDAVEGPGGEGLYVRYEMLLRRLETKFKTVVGLSGSCFAVRTVLTKNMRSNVPSDFSLMLQGVSHGYRGILAEDILCRYRTVQTEREEFPRKVRTVLRGLATFFACKEVLNPFRYGIFSWQILSHKLFRWLVPVFFILAFVLAVVQAPFSELYAWYTLLSVLFVAIAIVAYRYPILQKIFPVRIVLFFCISNAAILVAWWKYLRGERVVTWTPTERM
jgi:cellulose synthase/poly-beta-1,6-N-acetylglucosamine synthase-like glycosyltransferase